MGSKTIQANQFFKNKSNFHISFPPIIAVYELNNPENFGSIIRLADNIGALKVVFIGEQNIKASKIKKVASSSYNNVQKRVCTVEEFLKEIPEGYQLVAVETAETAVSIFDSKLPKKIVLLVGNESNGLSEEILEQCKDMVYIPMPGTTKSMNVSHALGIGIFEWGRQHIF